MKMFADDISEALPEMREYAESLMTLTVQAYEYGEGPDGNGIIVPKPVEFGDPCCAKVQGSSTVARDVAARYVTIGGVERPLLVGGLHLPLSAYVVDGVLQIKPGRAETVAWQFKVIEAGEDDDPALVGRRYLVWSVPAKSRATARRLDVVEL